MISCPKDLFNQLWNSRGSWFEPDSSEEKNFLCEALGEGLEYTGCHRVTIPKIPEGALEDWTLFGYWLDDIEPAVSLDDFSLDEHDLWSEGSPKPLALIGSAEDLKRKIWSILRVILQKEVGLVCVEIQASNKKLLIVYDNVDSWALGFGGRILVVENLDALTEEDGFYVL